MVVATSTTPSTQWWTGSWSFTMCCSVRKPSGSWRYASSAAPTPCAAGTRSGSQSIVVYPRIEALLARPSADDQWPDERCATGVNQLDAMLNGGMPRGTATLVLGASGAGKTSLGLHFLSRSSAEEPGLLFGF